MELIVSKSLDSWVEQAHQWVFNNYTYEGHRSFYIPAGNTPLPLYRYWEESRPQLLSQCQLIQIDEVLEGKKSNMFFHFFEENLPSWTSKLISPHENYHQGDAALLGLGLNGHLGFHEPELPEEVFFACVPLSPLTCKNLKLSASAWGITYGLQTFLRCPSVLLMVRGANKQKILEDILSPAHRSPAARLVQTHPGLTLLCDEDSALRI